MIYVDTMRAPFRNMIMCHMIADSSEELEQARRLLGIPQGSTQHPGTWREHLDVSLTKRAEAVKRLGAREISVREYARMMRERRNLANSSNSGTH